MMALPPRIDPLFSAWVRGIVREEVARLRDARQSLQALRDAQDDCTCSQSVCFLHLTIDQAALTGVPRS